MKKRDSVTTYCHIGQQASLLYFVARYLGYDTHLNDGSFEDWSHRPELPVVKEDAPKPIPSLVWPELFPDIGDCDRILTAA